jgi:hypothetical protein
MRCYPAESRAVQTALPRSSVTQKGVCPAAKRQKGVQMRRAVLEAPSLGEPDKVDRTQRTIQPARRSSACQSEGPTGQTKRDSVNLAPRDSLEDDSGSSWSPADGTESMRSKEAN